MHKKTSRTSLKIDWDRPFNYEYIDWLMFTERKDTVINILNLKILSKSTVETTNGKHIRIEVQGNYSPLEVVLIQSLIGSDFKRECFNFLRVKKGVPTNWNILFNEKRDLATNKIISKERTEAHKKAWEKKVSI